LSKYREAPYIKHSEAQYLGAFLNSQFKRTSIPKDCVQDKIEDLTGTGEEEKPA
jgi:hypothetical protein